MTKTTRDDKLAPDDPIIDDDSDWAEPAADRDPAPEPAKPAARSGPKRQAIEEYWERKRLRDALQDYLTEEES